LKTGSFEWWNRKFVVAPLMCALGVLPALPAGSAPSGWRGVSFHLGSGGCAFDIDQEAAVLASQERMQVVDLRNGKPAWNVSVDGSINVALLGGSVWRVEQTKKGALAAIRRSVATGEILGSISVTQPSSVFTTPSHRFLIRQTDSEPRQVVAYRPNGSFLWRRDGFVASSKSIMLVNGSRVETIDEATGKTLRVLKISSAPSVLLPKLAIMSDEEKDLLQGIDISTGEILWTRAVSVAGNPSGEIANLLITVSWMGGTKDNIWRGLDPLSGTTRWTKSIAGKPIFNSGVLYAGGNNGIIRIDPATGRAGVSIGSPPESPETVIDNTGMARGKFAVICGIVTDDFTDMFGTVSPLPVPLVLSSPQKQKRDALQQVVK
jgi:outer membrane protein assembly factor BamB